MARISALETERRALQIRQARSDRTYVPGTVLSAIHTLQYSVDPKQRVTALHTIGEHKDSFALTDVVSRLENENDLRVIEAAIDCIVTLRGSDYFEEMVQVLRRSREPKVHKACIAALGRLDPERAISLILNGTVREPVYQVDLLVALHKKVGHFVVDLNWLEEYLTHEDVRVRHMAVRLLVRYHDLSIERLGSRLDDKDIRLPNPADVEGWISCYRNLKRPGN